MYLFDVKGLDAQQYIDSMANNGQPLDEIGIVVIAYMYHVHIGIIMDGHFWTSCRDYDLKECKILLSWQGQLNFVDIKWKEQAEVPFYNLRKPRYPSADLADLPASPSPKFPPASKEDNTMPNDPAVDDPVPADPVLPQVGNPRYDLCSNPPAAKPPSKAVPKPAPSAKPASSDKVVGTISSHTVGICKHEKKKLKNLTCQIC